MNSVVLLLSVLAVELGGAAVDTSVDIELLVTVQGQLDAQLTLTSRDAGIYRFGDTSERLTITRLAEPDLTYTATYSSGGQVSAISAVSLLSVANDLATIRRQGRGDLISTDIVAGSSGDDAADLATSEQTEDPPDEPDLNSETGEAMELGSTGDITVRRTATALHIEHRGAATVLSLSNLR